MKNKSLTWPTLNYSRSASAYIIGVLAGVRVYDDPEAIPFYMIGALIISVVVTLFITIKNDTESHNWQSAFKEGTTYFIRYILTLLATFVLTALISKYLSPLLFK